MKSIGNDTDILLWEDKIIFKFLIFFGEKKSELNGTPSPCCVGAASIRGWPLPAPFLWCSSSLHGSQPMNEHNLLQGSSSHCAPHPGAGTSSGVCPKPCLEPGCSSRWQWPPVRYQDTDINRVEYQSTPNLAVVQPSRCLDRWVVQSYPKPWQNRLPGVTTRTGRWQMSPP